MVEVLAALGITALVIGVPLVALVWQRLRRPLYRIENVCPECHAKRVAALEKPSLEEERRLWRECMARLKK